MHMWQWCSTGTGASCERIDISHKHLPGQPWAGPSGSWLIALDSSCRAFWAVLDMRSSKGGPPDLAGQGGWCAGRPPHRRVQQQPARERITLCCGVPDRAPPCRELYECSCAELDTLIRLAREAGALAGRLTGAGWGGCMVALAENSKAGAVIQHLKSHYFAGARCRSGPAGEAGCLLARGAGQGASAELWPPEQTDGCRPVVQAAGWKVSQLLAPALHRAVHSPAP